MRRMPDLDILSPAEARRLALRAQRLDAPVAEGSEWAGTRHLLAALRAIRSVQIDSVNVFARAHYLPAFSRLGPYALADFDALADGPRPRMIEAWAHAAAFIPVEDWPLWQFRRDRFRRGDPSMRSWREWAEANGALLDEIRALVRASADHGVTVDEIEHERNRSRGAWWGWSDVKTGLELLFTTGEVVSGPRRGFRRVYMLPEHRIPADLREQEISETDALRNLVGTAARALGVATIADLADYFRL